MPVPDGVNQLLGTSATPRTSACRTQLPCRDPRRRLVTVYEQNVERATRAELWAPGEEVRLTWSPDHTFAVEAGGEPPPDVPAASRDAGAAARRARHRAGVSRRKFLVGGAIAVGGRRLRRLPRLDRRRGGEPPRRRRRPPPAVATPAGSPPRRRPPRRRRRPVAEPRPRPAPLQFANWLGYIDIDEDDGTLPDHREVHRRRPASTVDYVEAVDDNEEFFTGNLQGPLDAGLPTELGPHRRDRLDGRPPGPPRLARADRPSRMPNFVANLLRLYAVARATRTRSSQHPWQSGMTGLGFDQNKTGR